MKWITSFIDRKKFFDSEPDIHLIIRAVDIFNFGFDKNNIGVINSVLLALNSTKTTYNVYFLEDLSISNYSLLDNEDIFRWLFDLFYIRLNKNKLNFVFNCNFIVNNSQFVNKFFDYFSKQTLLNERKAFKIVGKVVCYNLEQFKDILLNVSLTEQFNVLYLVSHDDCNLDFSKVKEDFIALAKDRMFSFYVDYDFNFVKMGDLRSYFSFLKNFLAFYLGDLIKLGCRIWTFDNMLSLKGTHCFAGDCVKNNFIIDLSGNVFLCLKSVLSGKPFIRLGNIFEDKVDIKNVLDWFLVNEFRKKLLKQQEGSKLCNCVYWNLCHQGCVFMEYGYEKDNCFNFFEFLTKEARPIYMNIRREAMKQELRGYLSYYNNIFKGGY